MKLVKILRVLLCLALVCCLTIHAMIPKVEATSVAVPLIQKAAVVTGNPFVFVAATLICLGIYKGVESGAFETVANNCVDALEAAGTWIKDGAMELLRTEDADGNASYYVDSGLMEDVRSWAIDSSIVTAAMSCTATINSEGYRYFWSDIPFCHVAFTCTETNNYFVGVFTTQPGIIHNSYEFGLEYLKKEITANSSIGCPCNGYYWKVSYGTGSIPSYASDYLYLGDFTYEQLTRYDYGSASWSGAARFIANEIGLSFKSSAGVSLGSFPLSSIDLTDGTSARAWSEDYASKALMVDISGDDGGDYNLYFPMTLYPALEQLLASTQADQWAGAASPGFTDYEEKEEYMIKELPIVDGYQGVIVSPSDSQSGTQSGTTTGAVTLPGWLSDGINNLLQGLKDILSGILALPASIAKAIWDALPAWLTEGISSMVTGLRDILDAIKALPVAIAEALAAIFVPSADYISAKVDALRGEFGFIDSVIATGEFIRDSISGDSGPPVIYVDLGRAPSGNYGSQRVLLTDFSWYAPNKGQVDTVLSAALWAFFGWKVFLNLPSIIGGESGYISDIAFYESGGYYGGRAKEIRSGRSSRSKEKGGKG